MDENTEKEVDALVENKLKVPGNIFAKKETQATEDKTALSQAELIVQELSKQGIITIASNDGEVQSRILEQAKNSIAMELVKIENRGKQEVQKAVYDANKEACKYYGVSDSVETWKINMMKVGSAFWFVIWFIISSVSFTPISVLADKINNFIKSYWLALIISFLFFIFIAVGIPLLLTLNI